MQVLSLQVLAIKALTASVCLLLHDDCEPPVVVCVPASSDCTTILKIVERIHLLCRCLTKPFQLLVSKLVAKEFFNSPETYTASHQTGFDSSRKWLESDGAARKVFTNQQEYIAFERSETFHTIQRMVNALRNNKATSSSSHEPTRVITVRLPESLHEALKAEANDHSTSMNKLCIAKLLQVLEEDEVSRKKAAANNYNAAQQQAGYRQQAYQQMQAGQSMAQPANNPAYNNQVRQNQQRQNMGYSQPAQNRQLPPQTNPIQGNQVAGNTVQRQNLNNPTPTQNNPAMANQSQGFRANNTPLTNTQNPRPAAANYQPTSTNQPQSPNAATTYPPQNSTQQTPPQNQSTNPAHQQTPPYRPNF